MPNSLHKLTQYENLSLNDGYNLAAGHAYKKQTESLKSMLAHLPEIWYHAERSKPALLERDFVSSFFSLAHQHSMVEPHNVFLSYSASVSIEVVANYLKRKGMSAAVLHPTFDIIPEILRRVGVPITPVAENDLLSDTNQTLEQTLDPLETDAIFVVCPNNPTGTVLVQDRLTQLVEYCRRKNKLLIADFCFRYFSPAMFWDQYDLLYKSGIDFITVEDTGKTWQTLGLKVGMVVCNDRLSKDIFEIHNDILLGVSPFVLAILRKYIRNSEEEGIEVSITNAINANRLFLREALKGTILATEFDSTISVEWLRITEPSLDDLSLWNQLQERGVHLLPGSYFWWDTPDVGRRYVRVALMRSTDEFQEAALALREALLAIVPGMPSLIQNQGI